MKRIENNLTARVYDQSGFEATKTTWCDRKAVIAMLRRATVGLTPMDTGKFLHEGFASPCVYGIDALFRNNDGVTVLLRPLFFRSGVGRRWMRADVVLVVLNVPHVVLRSVGPDGWCDEIYQRDTRSPTIDDIRRARVYHRVPPMAKLASSMSSLFTVDLALQRTTCDNSLGDSRVSARLGIGDTLVFDTETTGLRIGDDEVLQIAWCLLDSDLKEVDRGCVYVNTGHSINRDALAVHGISRTVLEKKGVDPLRGLQRFHVALRRATVVCGFNLAFDVPMMLHMSTRYAPWLLADWSSVQLLDLMALVVTAPSPPTPTAPRPFMECTWLPMRLADAHRCLTARDFPGTAHDAMSDVIATHELLVAYAELTNAGVEGVWYGNTKLLPARVVQMGPWVTRLISNSERPRDQFTDPRTTGNMATEKHNLDHLNSESVAKKPRTTGVFDARNAATCRGKLHDNINDLVANVVFGEFKKNSQSPISMCHLNPVVAENSNDRLRLRLEPHTLKWDVDPDKSRVKVELSRANENDVKLIKGIQALENDLVTHAVQSGVFGEASREKTEARLISVISDNPKYQPVLSVSMCTPEKWATRTGNMWAYRKHVEPIATDPIDNDGQTVDPKTTYKELDADTDVHAMLRANTTVKLIIQPSVAWASGTGLGLKWKVEKVAIMDDPPSVSMDLF